MLDLAEFLAEIRTMSQSPWQRMSVMITKIQDAINQIGTTAGIDPTGHLAQPAPPQAINIKAGTDHIHVTLSDNSQRSRALNYFVEWSANDPSFGNSQVEDLGASRGRMLALPAKDGSGTPINYYLRGYSSYLGSTGASEKIVYGGKFAPSAVQLTGASQLTPLPSTGAGTSATNGSQGGQGFGIAQITPSQPARELTFV